MIDLQAYRIRIGMFSPRISSKLKMKSGLQHDAHALGLALILTLLIIGGVEQNPGPVSEASADQFPGPSFSGVTLMDVMEAIRITQFQIDGLSSKVHALTDMVTNMSQYGKTLSVPLTNRPTSHPSSSDRLHPTADSKQTTELEAPTTPAQARPFSPPPRSPDPRVGTDADSCHKRRSEAGATPHAGAVMLGCQNVRRIAAAARDEFLLGGQVVFRSIRGGTARGVLGALHGAVAGCRALRADLVLHVGGNDLAQRSVEYTLDCIAEVIKAAQQIRKVRDIAICSVPQDPSSGDILPSKCKDLNDELERLCRTERIRFIDLRPRLDECRFQGLDKSRMNLNRDGCRNAWQLLASEVVGFLG